MGIGGKGGCGRAGRREMGEKGRVDAVVKGIVEMCTAAPREQ